MQRFGTPGPSVIVFASLAALMPGWQHGCTPIPSENGAPDRDASPLLARIL